VIRSPLPGPKPVVASGFFTTPGARVSNGRANRTEAPLPRIAAPGEPREAAWHFPEAAGTQRCPGSAHGSRAGAPLRQFTVWRVVPEDGAKLTSPL